MTLLNYKSKMMSSFILKSAFVILFIQQCFSAPIETPYFDFVANLTQKNCVLPSEISFPISRNETTVEDSLLVCKTPDYYKFTKEVPILCNEIFGLLKNISCPPFNNALTTFTISISADVCGDIQLHKAILPKGLLLHLSDSFNCNIMCSNNFEAPCKVLLWSFLVQYQIINAEAQDISLKTTKNSSFIETKTTSNLQTSIQTNATNGTKSDSLKTSLVIAPQEIAGYQTLDAAQNPKESTKPIHSVQQQPNLETDAIVNNAQETAVKNPEVPKLETVDGVKLKPLIPTNNTLGSAKNVGGNRDDGLVNNDLISRISQVKGNLTKITDPKPPQKLPTLSEQNDKNFFEAKENDPAAGTISTKNQENENDGSDIQVESKITVPDNTKNKETTSKTGQSSTVSEKKDKNADASPVVKLPSNLLVEPTKEFATVGGEVSESVPSPTSVISVSVTPSLEKMEEEIPLPNDKESDQYNLDNAEGDIDGEYSKQDYGDGMYEPAKNKESISAPPISADIPKEPIVPQNDEKAFDGLTRGSFGRGPEEVQEFATFPDQEDSHFFFYFLSIVLILMAGYLIFHNKQKIIALIVEGRHERRRRSHGLGYKKLETK